MEVDKLDQFQGVKYITQGLADIANVQMMEFDKIIESNYEWLRGLKDETNFKSLKMNKCIKKFQTFSKSLNNKYFGAQFKTLGCFECVNPLESNVLSFGVVRNLKRVFDRKVEIFRKNDCDTREYHGVQAELTNDVEGIDNDAGQRSICKRIKSQNAEDLNKLDYEVHEEHGGIVPLANLEIEDQRKSEAKFRNLENGNFDNINVMEQDDELQSDEKMKYDSCHLNDMGWTTELVDGKKVVPFNSEIDRKLWGGDESSVNPPLGSSIVKGDEKSGLAENSKNDNGIIGAQKDDGCNENRAENAYIDECQLEIKESHSHRVEDTFEKEQCTSEGENKVFSDNSKAKNEKKCKIINVEKSDNYTRREQERVKKVGQYAKTMSKDMKMASAANLKERKAAAENFTKLGVNGYCATKEKEKVNKDVGFKGMNEKLLNNHEKRLQLEAKRLKENDEKFKKMNNMDQKRNERIKVIKNRTFLQISNILKKNRNVKEELDSKENKGGSTNLEKMLMANGDGSLVVETKKGEYPLNGVESSYGMSDQGNRDYVCVNEEVIEREGVGCNWSRFGGDLVEGKDEKSEFFVGGKANPSTPNEGESVLSNLKKGSGTKSSGWKFLFSVFESKTPSKLEGSKNAEAVGSPLWIPPDLAKKSAVCDEKSAPQEDLDGMKPPMHPIGSSPKWRKTCTNTTPRKVDCVNGHAVGSKLEGGFEGSSGMNISNTCSNTNMMKTPSMGEKCLNEQTFYQSPEFQYSIGDYNSDSDDHSEVGPFWTRKENLYPALIAQMKVNSEEIFRDFKKSCDLDKIFSDLSSKSGFVRKFRPRTSSADWSRDRFDVGGESGNDI